MSAGAAGATPAEPMPPWHRQVRWQILGALLVITVINFLDRQALSVVAPLLRDRFGFSNQDYGRIVAAFQLGMLLAEFPVGWMMDRRGARFGLAFVVLYWSLANALHAAVASVAGFAVVRFALGSGECGNFSGGVKVVSEWFPARERALAIGVFNSGSMLGAMLAPPFIAAITLVWGWRVGFVLPSVFGFLWVVLWLRVYWPLSQHARLSPAEARHIQEGRAVVASAALPRNRDLLCLPQTWGLMACRFLVGPVVQFYIYWTPEYLFRVRGMSLAGIGASAWVPFLFGGLGSVGGGWMSGWLLLRGHPLVRARGGALLAGGLLCLSSLGVAYAGSAALALFAMALVMVGHTLLSANMFAAISDIFPSAAVARVTGLTGIAGGISGVLFPLATGLLVDRGSYLPVFVVAALMPLSGVLCLLAFSRGFARVPVSTL